MKLLGLGQCIFNTILISLIIENDPKFVFGYILLMLVIVEWYLFIKTK